MAFKIENEKYLRNKERIENIVNYEMEQCNVTMGIDYYIKIKIINYELFHVQDRMNKLIKLTDDFIKEWEELKKCIK